MSVEFIAAESKFQRARTEYMSIMSTVKTCRGQMFTRACQRAAELNADMQTLVMEMSTLVKVEPAPVRVARWKEYVSIQTQLKRDLNGVLKEVTMNTDLQVLSAKFKAESVMWFMFASLLVIVMSI